MKAQLMKMLTVFVMSFCLFWGGKVGTDSYYFFGNAPFAN